MAYSVSTDLFYTAYVYYNLFILIFQAYLKIFRKLKKNLRVYVFCEQTGSQRMNYQHNIGKTNITITFAIFVRC